MNESLKEKLLDCSRKIAVNIYDKRITIDNEVSWVYKTKSIFSRHPRFSYLDDGFYNGESGMAWFFLYASSCFEESRYFDLADKIIRDNTKRFLYEYERNIDKESFERYKLTIQCSGYSYPLCLLNLMDHADALYPDKGIWDETVAHAFLEWLDRNVYRDLSTDLLSGLAGCITVLLNIYERKKNPRFLELARRCADNLLEGAKEKEDFVYWLPDITSKDKSINYSISSFAYGTTGIAFALAQMYAVTRQEKYLQYSIKALNCKHERLFTGDIPADIKYMSEEEFQFSWCNGRTGELWGRVFVNYFSNEILNKNLKFEKEGFIQNGLGNSFPIMYGDAGNLEILKLLAIASKDDTLDRKADEHLEKNIDAFRATGKFNFGEGNSLMGYLGLFDGEAGIGYQMLRFALWEKIPSLLAMESPMLNIKPLHIKL